MNGIKPNREEILAGIRQVLASRLKIDAELTPETDLLSELQLDSLQQLTLVVELENHFRVCFDPGEEEGIRTVDSVADLIERRLAAKREAA